MSATKPTDRMETSLNRWYELGWRAQSLAMAGFCGSIRGLSFTAEAITTERLAALLADAVERADHDEQREQALALAAKQEGADE